MWKELSGAAVRFYKDVIVLDNSFKMRFVLIRKVAYLGYKIKKLPSIASVVDLRFLLPSFVCFVKAGESGD